jgi:hypothetical protein
MESIFQMDVMAQQTETDKEAAKKQTSITEKQKEITSIFHNIHKDVPKGEPDWQGMLLNAKDATQKMHIRAAREAYQEEQRIRAFEEQHRAFDQRIDRLLATPQHQRNKFWYEDLKKNDPSAWWDSRVQKQRQKDRETLKLAFHLKAR